MRLIFQGFRWGSLAGVTVWVPLSIQRSRVQLPSSPPIFRRLIGKKSRGWPPFLSRLVRCRTAGSSGLVWYKAGTRDFARTYVRPSVP